MNVVKDHKRINKPHTKQKVATHFSKLTPVSVSYTTASILYDIGLV